MKLREEDWEVIPKNKMSDEIKCEGVHMRTKMKGTTSEKVQDPKMNG